jgi:soluble lytic murein transglycosylase-like protein
MNAWKNAFYISVLLILTLSAGQVGTKTNVSVGLAEHLETKSRILSTLTQKLPKRYTHHAEEISQTIMKQATTHKIDPWMITAVISGESSFNPNAIGPIGEIGLMQLRPRSAEWVAHKMNIKWKGKKALRNPVYNIQIGVAYLGHLKNALVLKGDIFISRPTTWGRALS